MIFPLTLYSKSFLRGHSDDGPLLRGNPSDDSYSRHLPISVRGKNLPLTALVKGVGGIMGTT